MSMRYEEVCWYSSRLNKDMNIKIYGHYGIPIIAFPCQDKHSDDFSNNGMIDTLSRYIEEGKIKLYCLDSNDNETVSSTSWDKAHAGYMLEMYHQYLVNEVMPFIYSHQQGHCYPYLIGMSMGASHAANNFFRRPDLFSGFISLSGEFNIARFFDGYMDENIYNNSPINYLSNMDNNHHYIDIYNQKTMIVVVGDGDYEYLVKDSNIKLKEIADQKNIHINFNFWDQNSIHDWSSWKYQMPIFIEKII